MKISREVKRQQRKWAKARGFVIDQNGYLDERGQNFERPLSPGFEQALEDAGGGELQDQRHRPAKIYALHSSAVLAINFFQYWEGRTGPELPRALGIDGDLASVKIEQQFSTGLRGTPPTLDVVVKLQDERLVAIESKFTEWTTKKRPDLARLQEKYLKPGALWADAGLPECQQLAADLVAGTESFRHLDALQLLKHVLGLSKSQGARFSLFYLYFDYEGESEMAALHREEVERFAARVDGVLGFRGLSYQQLFAALAATEVVESDYIDYLRQRYFPGAGRSAISED
jgi:hypothetical protein